MTEYHKQFGALLKKFTYVVQACYRTDTPTGAKLTMGIDKGFFNEFIAKYEEGWQTEPDKDAAAKVLLRQIESLIDMRNTPKDLWTQIESYLFFGNVHLLSSYKYLPADDYNGVFSCQTVNGKPYQVARVVFTTRPATNETTM